MKIICDRCGQRKEVRHEIILKGQKICLACLAADRINLMKMPDMPIRKKDVLKRIERLEEKLERNEK